MGEPSGPPGPPEVRTLRAVQGGKGRKAQNLRRTLGRIERFSQGDLLGLWEDGARLPGKAEATRKRKRGCALSFEDKVAHMGDDHFVGQIRALVGSRRGPFPRPPGTSRPTGSLTPTLRGS